MSQLIVVTGEELVRLKAHNGRIGELIEHGQTSPPIRKEAAEKSPKSYTLVLGRVLMEESIKKFAEPQMALPRLIAQKRASANCL